MEIGLYRRVKASVGINTLLIDVVYGAGRGGQPRGQSTVSYFGTTYAGCFRTYEASSSFVFDAI